MTINKVFLSLIVFMAITQTVLPHIFQYFVNIAAAMFVVFYLILTINRVEKKPWTNKHITKTERIRVLYIAVTLLMSFIFLNIAWGINSYETDNTLSVSLVLDKVYALQETAWLFYACYVTFQINLEINLPDDDTFREGIITQVMKGRLFKQATRRESNAENN